jgi:hypothetical protein
VKQALAAAYEVEDVDSHRYLVASRLDAMQDTLCDQDMAGHLPSVTDCLRIIEARCKLLGLYRDRRTKDPKDHWDNCSGPPTVIPEPNDCRHEGCDRHGRFERLAPR